MKKAQCLDLGGEMNAFLAPGPSLVLEKQPRLEQVQGSSHRAGPLAADLIPLPQYPAEQPVHYHRLPGHRPCQQRPGHADFTASSHSSWPRSGPASPESRSR
jgi:hypothetical protein